MQFFSVRLFQDAESKLARSTQSLNPTGGLGEATKLQLPLSFGLTAVS